eukprot:5248147-Amphidinium_carterae.1
MRHESHDLQRRSHVRDGSEQEKSKFTEMLRGPLEALQFHLAGIACVLHRKRRTQLPESCEPGGH